MEGTSVAELVLTDLRKGYNGKEVLKGIDLTVEDGELISLLGPSGCGKTTTLSIIAGFIDSDSGTVAIDGQDITSEPPNRRDTAMIFQDYALFPHMTVRNNVAYGLQAHRVAKAEIVARVQEAARLVGIEDFLDRFPGQLSGGQRQRVAVARAVVLRPKVLLMDEPLSNLDARLRQDIRVEIRRLQQRLKQTVVFVTHDQEEALSISDRVVVMNGGAIEQVGTPMEVFEHPQTRFVADFLGVANIFPGSHTGGVFTTDSGIDIALAASNHPQSTEINFVGIRPSAVRVSAGTPQPTDGSKAVQTTVLEAVYMGETWDYTLQVSGSTQVIKAETGRSQGFTASPGDAVVAYFPPEAVLPLR
jgi:ABC-type Fe3+/spermidine/putrescine transport system ATPase subunit